MPERSIYHRTGVTARPLSGACEKKKLDDGMEAQQQQDLAPRAPRDTAVYSRNATGHCLVLACAIVPPVAYFVFLWAFASDDITS